MRLSPVLFLACLTTPAWADDPCHDLWFTRNLVFDRAGYCFGSALGQSVFDNSDCTTKSPSLSAADAARVAAVKEGEGNLGCAVNTASTRLDLSELGLRMRLDPPPVLDPLGLGWGCLGWRGETATLHVAQSPAAPVTGQILPGDRIYSAHVGENGWGFYSVVSGATGQIASGWTTLRVPYEKCDDFAG